MLCSYGVREKLNSEKRVPGIKELVEPMKEYNVSGIGEVILKELKRFSKRNKGKNELALLIFRSRTGLKKISKSPPLR